MYACGRDMSQPLPNTSERLCMEQKCSVVGLQAVDVCRVRKSAHILPREDNTINHGKGEDMEGAHEFFQASRDMYLLSLVSSRLVYISLLSLSLELEVFLTPPCLHYL